MRIFYYLSLLILLSINSCFAQLTLSGKIIDKSTNEVLSGASVSISDLQSGTTSKDDGTYTIKNLPKGKFLVQVRFIGYSTITNEIDFTTVQKKDFYLEPSTIETAEVVITGNATSSENERSSVSVVSIEKDALRTMSPTNVINALTSIPGVSEITTGVGVSKPVIRGLAYNHVVTINEGIRQEGNQWGPEHGMEIDQFQADRVEILKGPASLFYGSDALGGVVNFLEPVMPSTGTIKGELASNYATNNRLTASSLMLEGNNNGFVWSARATYKNAASFQTPDYYVYNSGFNENNYSSMIGLQKKWGFTHLHFSRFNAYIGAVDGARDSATNKFIDANGNIVPANKLNSRTLDLPFNNVIHTKISSISNIIINNSQLKINVGLQSNQRKEFDDNMNNPNVYFLLNTITYDAKLLLPKKNGFETAIGLSGMTQTNQNKGNEYVVPNYFLQDLGGFAYIKKSFNKLTANAGARFDMRNITGKSLFLDSIGKPVSTSNDTIFKAFHSNFQAASGAIGFTYQFNKTFNAKLNIGRGYRAPNIYELATSMNGAAPDPGTFCFNAGNYDLKPETSIQIDGEISAKVKYFDVTFSAFYNHIDNYIYQRNINNEQKLFINQSFPVYRFVQGNSLLEGVECGLNIHPNKTINFENTLALVKGTNLSTNIPLPFIPATHSRHEIKWFCLKGKSTSLFSHVYIKFGVKQVWKQDRYDIFETETGSYTLLNGALGCDIKIGKQKMTIFINGENLTNVKYFDNLNRFKDINIYNPGRNIIFGINIPFSNENLKK